MRILHAGNRTGGGSTTLCVASEITCIEGISPATIVINLSPLKLSLLYLKPCWLLLL
jgi:hypothetical protein